MTPREEGFLLLTGFLGDPDRKPLTIAQLRSLAQRARMMERPKVERELTSEDLIALGYNQTMAARIVGLLSQNAQLQWYMGKGYSLGCTPITRISEGYPESLRRLGPDAPGALWTKGDRELLRRPAISLVGSRDLRPDNRGFAWEIGKQAALQGYVLVSGNARGADRTAQEACLTHGGSVISVVADALSQQKEEPNILYVSEEGFDLPFTSQRALQRNRIIHAWGQKVFVAQCRLGKGGTWSGTRMNLKKGLRPVFCFRDGSAAAEELMRLGADLVTQEDLVDISQIQPMSLSFLDP